MTTAILIGGLIVTLLVAIAMRRPEWRLPAVIFAILAIPGNVDNLMPQMRLDPNALANNTAPVVSFVDVLIVWALVLAFREGRLRRMRPPVAQVSLWARQVLEGEECVACSKAGFVITTRSTGDP